MGTFAPMASSRTDLLLAGRYRLGGLLGSGGMADVYEGTDERLGRQVAVKLLRPEMAVRADVRQRFEAEARSAASLSHPNVVAVFDSGEDGEIPFLVMEKLPGETLGDRMRDGPVDVEWMLRVAGDVLGALAAAHASGMVHRDVKPGNILIAADGRAKVADFGIAKSLEVAAAADLTGTNQIVGTPAYVAPERILGQPATVQADLYAVGVLVYEALAGQKPFAGDTPVATAYAIQHVTPPSLSEVRPELPARVVEAVERAMARNPEDRFASATVMAAALGVVGGAAGPAAPGAGDDATTLAASLAGAGAGAGDDATSLAGASQAVDAGSTQVLPAGTGVGPPTRTSSASTPVAVARAQSMAADAWHRVGRDRRRLVIVAGAATVIALVLLGLLASAGSDDQDSPGQRLAAEMRKAADDLDAEDGAAAAEAAAALAKVADATAEGDGGPEATALLRQLAAWRDGSQLNPATTDLIARLLKRVPGVDPNAYTPPTTAPPTTAAPPEEEKKDEDEDKGRGKGRKGDD